MNTNEKWNIIVADYNKNKSEQEDVIQNLWEDYFTDSDIFSYSRRSGEVHRRQMQIGSRERAIPDLIIKDSAKNEDLFIVELKQYNLPYQDKFKEQLFSYMKMSELNVGILVCNKIYVYFRGYKDTESFIEIPFVENNPNGIKFIELFSKGNFAQQKVKDFISEKCEFDKHVKEITQDVLNLDVKNLVTEHYNQNYTREEIDKALAKIKINVNIEERQIPPPVTCYAPPPQTSLMTRGKAIELFRNSGFQLYKNITFASKNKTANNYWANPDITNLNQEFWLILHDNISKKLYLFDIPANAIQKSQLVTRSDKPNTIDLQIAYNDLSFTDNRSGYSFKPFLVKEIDY